MNDPARIAPTDDFEAEHMPAEGRVLRRSKQVSRAIMGVGGFFGFLLIVFATLVAAGVTSPMPQLLSLLFFALGGVCAFLGFTMSGLRAVLTSEELRVQLGLWGPRVPVSAIESCEVVDYDPLKYGGYGLKYRNGIHIYSVPGSRQAVALRYADASGDTKQLVFTADDPVAMAAAIQKARKVRIAAEDGARSDEAAVGEAEREALAEQEAQRAEQQAQRVDK